jgi:hypothetical protein
LSVTNTEKMVAELEDPYILIHERPPDVPHRRPRLRAGTGVRSFGGIQTGSGEAGERRFERAFRFRLPSLLDRS